jgi:hypothetical protein
MPDNIRRKILKFIRIATEIVFQSHVLIGALVFLVLGIIEAWHVIHVALLH